MAMPPLVTNVPQNEHFPCGIALPRLSVSSSSACRSSSAWPAGFTFGKTRASLPSGSTMNVARSTPMYSRPMNFFWPQTPYGPTPRAPRRRAAGTAASNLSRNFWCDLTESGETPKSFASPGDQLPSCRGSRRPRWCSPACRPSDTSRARPTCRADRRAARVATTRIENVGRGCRFGLQWHVAMPRS